jgi:seryl-tRNA synthetase/acyl carrier protein
VEGGGMNQQQLAERIVSFVNATLLASRSPRVSADTPLFEDGLLDSMRVLDLIAFVEAEAARPLPDSLIRLANFRTAATIAATALDPAAAGKPSRDRIWSRTRGRRRAGAPAAGASLEDELLQWGHELRAREVGPAPLIPLADLARAGYLDSFPGRAVAAASGDGSDGELAIPPAACFHCYATLADRVLASTPAVFALRNRCARGDETLDPAHGRLREFTMREIVIIGMATEVDRARRALMRRAQTYLTRLDLSATIEVATDPFHVAGDRGKLALQRLRALKYELRMPVAGESIAVASFNHHEDHFGRAFGISLRDGSPAHTACVAFGLERWELAVRAQRDAAAADMVRSA